MQSLQHSLAARACSRPCQFAAHTSSYPWHCSISNSSSSSRLLHTSIVSSTNHMLAAAADTAWRATQCCIISSCGHQNSRMQLRTFVRCCAQPAPQQACMSYQLLPALLSCSSTLCRLSKPDPGLHSYSWRAQPAVLASAAACSSSDGAATAPAVPGGAPSQTTPNPTAATEINLSSNPTTSSSRGNTSSSSSGSSSSNGSSSAASGDWVVNKQPISYAMDPQLYSYLLSHTREPPVLAELRLETAGMHGGHMQVSPEQGQLLSLLVELLGVTSALEVGVFTGYSSLAVALALPANGRLVAFDRDANSMAVAQRYWRHAGVADKVDSRLGPALEGLQQLLEQEGEGGFDMAFIDADKRAYQAYFEVCLRLVRPGGLIAVDNVLFYGKVADAGVSDKATLALRAFNEQLMADERVSFSIVPIGDGMALCRKR